jgi:hypothetical protein
VQEWTETKLGRLSLVMRGGAFDNGYIRLHAAIRNQSGGAEFEGYKVGFRIASIPEPSTLLLLCIGSLTMLFPRGRPLTPALHPAHQPCRDR